MPDELWDIEDLLQAIDDKLMADMNTQLAAITASKDDGITLPTLKDVVWFSQEDENAAGPWITLNPTGWTETETGGTEVTLEVMAWVEDDGTSNMPKIRLRWLKALRRMFAPGASFADIQIARTGAPEFVGMELGDPPRALLGVGMQLKFAYGE